jgi:hypothetical protein
MCLLLSVRMRLLLVMLKVRLVQLLMLLLLLMLRMMAHPVVLLLSRLVHIVRSRHRTGGLGSKTSRVPPDSVRVVWW